MHFNFDMHEERQLLIINITVNPCTFILLALYLIVSNGGNKRKVNKLFRLVPRLSVQRLEFPRRCKTPKTKSSRRWRKILQKLFPSYNHVKYNSSCLDESSPIQVPSQRKYMLC